MPAVEEVGLSQLAGAIATLGTPPRTYAPLFAKYKVLLSSESKKCFGEGRSPDGQPWAPLKRPRERQRDKRAKGGSGQKPLRDTDLLMLSVTAKGRGHTETETDTSLTWGSNLPYAAIHQEGGSIQYAERRRERPWVFRGPNGETIFTRRIRAHTVTIPARPFLGISDRTADLMADMAADFVMQQLKQRSLRK